VSGVRSFDVALAATLHDPTGTLLADAEAGLAGLGRLYRTVAVATSPPTSAAMKALLARAGVHAPDPRGNLRGPLYRGAIRHALRGGAARVHYVDFDRVLRWARRAPRELAGVLRLASRHPVLVVGRTQKAHRSHHLPLYATETLVNRLIATRLGLGAPIDWLAPSFVLARADAARLIAASRARDVAIYGELAALLAGLGREIAYVECGGLDWETPDRHRRTVRRIGLPAFRRRLDRPAEWAFRGEIAREIVRGFVRAHARRAAARVGVRRLPPRVGR
jgi:hypothetical protein